MGGLLQLPPPTRGLGRPDPARAILGKGESRNVTGVLRTYKFRTLHAIAMDARRRIFVGDRGNNRVPLFDQEGKFLTQWTQFGRPSGMLLRPQGPDLRGRLRIRRRADSGLRDGFRIGDARTEWVTEFIHFPCADPGETAGNGAEFVAVDIDGNIYGGEPGPSGCASTSGCGRR